VHTVTTNSEGVSVEKLLELRELFGKSISHPAGTSLLSYPDHWGLSRQATPEEIVREAVSWRPRVLAMTVTEVGRHVFRQDLFAIMVEVKGKIHTQVISPIKPNVGDVYAIALSGVRLPDGREVKHGFRDRMYSVGDLLGKTEKPEGTELSPDEFPRA
jgi:hypothetical protein